MQHWCYNGGDATRDNVELCTVALTVELGACLNLATEGNWQNVRVEVRSKIVL